MRIESKYVCDFCGREFTPTFLNDFYVAMSDGDGTFPRVYDLCPECEKPVRQAAMRAKEGRGDDSGESPAKRCPFSHGKGGTLHVDANGAVADVDAFGDCTDDCALYFAGKCALAAIAEAMC